MTTPEERIAVLETKMSAIESKLSGMDGKLDTLVEAFNMGRGRAIAWAKIGGYVLLVATGAAWVWDHLISPLLGAQGGQH